MKCSNRNSASLLPKARLLSTILCTLFALLSMSSCQGPDEDNVDQAYVYIDQVGRKIALSKPPQKVVGLSPAITEILFALGADSLVAGVSHVDNYPPEKVKSKPVVNTYPLDVEALHALKPDLVLTEEGMTSYDNIEKLQSLGIPVYVCKFTSVAQLLTTMHTISEILGVQLKAKPLLDSLQNTLQQWELKSSANRQRPKVLALIWQDPIYAHGHGTVMADKIRLAGGLNIVDSSFKTSFPELSREYILLKNPDVILGSDFLHMDTTFFRLYPELKTINAYQNKRIYHLNDDLATRPGPRVFESISEIHRLLFDIR